MGSLLLSVLANILSTLIEYGIIKPKFETTWNPLLAQPGNRDWSTAVKRSIQRFQSTQGSHMLPFGEHYRVEDVHIEKGKGTITLVVLPKTALVFAFTSLSFLIDTLNVDEFPHIMARYQIIIDRTGDILNMKSIPVSENERYRPLYSPRSRLSRFASPFKSSNFPDFNNFFQKTTPPKKRFELKINKPIKEIVAGNLLLRFGFTVENWGEATTIYPYIRYKIAELQNGKFIEKIVLSPEDWKVELKAYSSTPIEFRDTLPIGTQLLAKGKDSVYVRIYQKPWARTNTS